MGLLKPSTASRPAHARTLLVAAIALAGFAAGFSVRAQGTDHWVGTWSAALVPRPQPQGSGPAAPPPQAAPAPAQGQAGGAGRGGALPTTFSDQTLRQIVHTSVGGNRVRVVFSNVFGTGPLPIGAADIALRDAEAAIVATSAHPLTFGGSPSARIAPGGTLTSDPVTLTVTAGADLAVDLYVADTSAEPPSPLTLHTTALQTNYISSGNQVGTPQLPAPTTAQAWFFMARVEVATPQNVGAIVMLGDSITDGFRSTANANARWPDQLAKRLRTQTPERPMAVLNAGISGNRLLLDGAGPNALARFDRDALEQPGATHLVLMEGINDIGTARQEATPTAQDLINAHMQLIARAHARGLKILGATLTPFEGANYWTAEGEAKRQALNTWIRTSRAYDGVIDFDLALRDPEHPTKLAAAYQSGDNLHPNDLGYALMAATVDLKLFESSVR